MNTEQMLLLLLLLLTPNEILKKTEQIPPDTTI